MKAVLKHEKKWLSFKHPKKVLRAGRIEEVQPMLKEATESGLFAVGFVSYEAAPAFDAVLKTHSINNFPLLCLGLFTAPEVLDSIDEPVDATYAVGELVPSVTKNQFATAIAKVKEQLAAGATYQVNYTYRLGADFSGNDWAFFCELTRAQPTDYAAYIDMGDFAICSASPELFFKIEDGQIITRPMKGTAARGRTVFEDRHQAESLRQSEKNRAENIMIVDMIRNDIGRIAVPGSIEVVSRFDVEKYPTVWQMTSTVRGRLSPKDTNGICEVMAALFPCASITGAPKAKTMEIIQSLETKSRKVYTGSIGFITPQGEACFNVAIRTALIDRATGSLEYGVGGGIVWDSDVESEYQETLNKAQLLTQPYKPFQLLETLLWEPDDGFFLLNEHLQRVGQSASYFDVPLDLSAIRLEMERLAGTLADVPHRFRLLVSLDGFFEIQHFPLDLSASVEPVRIAFAKEPIDSTERFLFHKTTNRQTYELAQKNAPTCDEVILWNERGEVTESIFANIVIRQAGKFITPPILCGLLGGTLREQLLREGKLSEKVIRRDELQQADEIYLINSVRRWRRARLVDI